jgi:ribosomal-protein-alanine N-acetyltransferase
MTIFETPHLIVRTLLDSDFPHLFRLQSDPVTMRYIRAPATDEQPVRERVAMWETYREKCPGLGVFALKHKQDESFAGYVTARHVDFDPATGEYEIGYAIAPEWWGQGLASEVVLPLCRYLFAKTGTPKIVAFTDPANVVSQRVLLKNGFREVGRRQVYEGVSAEFWLEKSEA